MELNKVLLIGNLVADPIYRTISSGKSVADMRLACSRRLPPNRETGERQDESVFIDVTIWEKGADFARNYLRKGSRIFVEGRLRQENWQDKESGAQRSKISVLADRIQFAESRAEAEARGVAPSGGYAAGYEEENSPVRAGAANRATAREAVPRDNAVRREAGPPSDYGNGPGFTQDPSMGAHGGTDDDLPF